MTRSVAFTRKLAVITTFFCVLATFSGLSLWASSLPIVKTVSSQSDANFEVNLEKLKEGAVLFYGALKDNEGLSGDPRLHDLWLELDTDQLSSMTGDFYTYNKISFLLPKDFDVHYFSKDYIISKNYIEKYARSAVWYDPFDKDGLDRILPNLTKRPDYAEKSSSLLVAMFKSNFKNVYSATHVRSFSNKSDHNMSEDLAEALLSANHSLPNESSILRINSYSLLEESTGFSPGTLLHDFYYETLDPTTGEAEKYVVMYSLVRMNLGFWASKLSAQIFAAALTARKNSIIHMVNNIRTGA